jgi:tape measure domain-containing protein
MSNDVENRVVKMTFDNANFAAKMEETIKGLDRLSKSLKMAEGVKGMADAQKQVNSFKMDGVVKTIGDAQGAMGKFNATPVVNAVADAQGAVNKFDASNMGDQADKISAKWVAMAAGIFAVVSGLVTQIGSKFASIGSSFTLGPLKDGFSEYQTNVGAIQTILANTDRYGTKLPEVTANLDELNTYSDKTIYNFGEMVKNIGLFTNAGIRVGDATSMIKGFSNAAAASGTTAEGAAGAAYQLSQALSNGTVRLMDWRSLTNVGMGNKNMQQGIIELADSMGTLSAAGVSSEDATAHFTDTLEKGWLSADVMSNYLKIMAGDMDRAQMAAMGLSGAQIDWFERQQNIAEDAATKVRTFKQLIGTVKESIGSGWSETFRIVIGDFEQATNVFTGINNTISGMVGKAAKARNDLLNGWDFLGGRNAVGEGLVRTWVALLAVIQPVQKAFRSVFPKTTVTQLATFSDRFRNFTKTLMPAKETVMAISRIFKGFFSLIKIGVSVIWEIGKLVVSVFRDAFGGTVRSGIVPFAAKLGDVITAVSRFLSEGGRLKNFFAALRGAIHHVLGPVKGLMQIFIAIGKVVGGVFSAVLSVVIGLFRELFGATAKQGKGAADTIAAFLDKVTRGMIYAVYYIDEFGNKLRSSVSTAKDFVKGVKDVPTLLNKIKDKLLELKDAFVGDFGNPFADIKDPTIAAIISKVGDAFGRTWEKIQDFSDGGVTIFDGIKKSIAGADWFGMLKDVGHKLYESFMTAIDAHSPSRMFADAALAIPQGIAEGIKTGWSAIKSAMDWVGDKLHELFGGIGDAIASDNLSRLFTGGVIVGIMSMIKDITGVFGAIGDSFGAVDNVIDEFGDTLQAFQMQLKADALLAIAIAVGVLALSMIALSLVPADKLQKAGAAMAGALTGITAAFVILSKTDATGKKMASTALGMVFVAGSMLLLAFAVEKLGSMDLETLGVGLRAVGVALIGFTTAFRLIGDQNENVAKAGFAMVLMAGAMWVMGVAVEKMGNLEWEVIKHGLVGVAGAMTIMIVAMRQMSKKDMTKAGLGMLLMSFSLGAMADAVQQFGEMDWEVIRQGLGGLAAALAIIVIAMRKMPKNMPSIALEIGVLTLSLIGIAAVVKIFGGMGLENITQGMIALAVALGVIVLAANGMSGASAGAAALVAMAIGITMIADAIKLLGGMSWDEIKKGIGGLALAMIVLGVAAAALGLLAPAIIVFGVAMLTVGIAFALFGAGVLMVAQAISILATDGQKGIDQFINMIEEVAKVLPTFLGAMAEGFIEAFVSILNGMGPVIDALGEVLLKIIDKIIEISPQIFELISTLLEGMLGLIEEHGPAFIETMVTLFSSLLEALTGILPQIAQFALDMIMTIINTLTENAFQLVTAGVNLLLGFAEVLITYAPVLAGAGLQLLVALINAISANVNLLVTAVTNLIVSFINTLALNLYQIVQAGANLIVSFVTGLGNESQKVVDAGVDAILKFIEGVGNSALDLANGAADALVDFLEGLEESIRTNSTRIQEAGAGVADAIIDGLVAAIGDGVAIVGGAIEGLAGSAIDAAKNFLGIKSPSRVFREIGDNVIAGLVIGLKDRASSVPSAVKTLSKGLSDAFENHLGSMAIGDINPTITPVIDLSNVKMGVDAISSMMGGASIDAGVSLVNARSISSATSAPNESPTQTTTSTPGGVMFIQNNYSPKALSEADILSEH